MPDIEGHAAKLVWETAIDLCRYILRMEPKVLELLDQDTQTKQMLK